jgi:alpha-N-acetylglucosamine transferase
MLKTSLPTTINKNLTLLNVWNITEADRLIDKPEDLLTRNPADSLTDDPIIITERIDYPPDFA